MVGSKYIEAFQPHDRKSKRTPIGGRFGNMGAMMIMNKFIIIIIIIV